MTLRRSHDGSTYTVVRILTLTKDEVIGLDVERTYDPAERQANSYYKYNGEEPETLDILSRIADWYMMDAAYNRGEDYNAPPLKAAWEASEPTTVTRAEFVRKHAALMDDLRLVVYANLTAATQGHAARLANACEQIVYGSDFKLGDFDPDFADYQIKLLKHMVSSLHSDVGGDEELCKIMSDIYRRVKEAQKA
jgi:hypothetical protein